MRHRRAEDAGNVRDAHARRRAAIAGAALDAGERALPRDAEHAAALLRLAEHAGFAAIGQALDAAPDGRPADNAGPGDGGAENAGELRDRD
jgi:hypothetical protein